MAGKIFINYRREDTRADAARMRDRLAAAFGASNVFMDVDNLMAGQRFDQELAKALNECDVLLAVIGPQWEPLLAERARSGGRDYVREEIAEALERGVIVIPVLIERVPVPAADRLPEDIRPLVLHQKHDVSHERFGRDVAELIQAIKQMRGAHGPRRSAAKLLRIAAVVLALAGAAVVGI
uniref:toll/interleukin-1 receptor domain-containing protein n=1 Tax=uncultured Hyphomicrobium sp. TaxID=194373 RepID=UPI0025CB8C57